MSNKVVFVCCFRCFVFSPDVPIRLDYAGKRVDMEQVRGAHSTYSTQISIWIGVSFLFARVSNRVLADIRKQGVQIEVS